MFLEYANTFCLPSPCSSHHWIMCHRGQLLEHVFQFSFRCGLSRSKVCLAPNLRFRCPTKSADKYEILLTLPFVRPDGQGNIEKYLHGRENSAKWGAQYGPLSNLVWFLRRDAS
jgi:hypothetical protein